MVDSLQRTFQEIWTNPDESYVLFMDEVARAVYRTVEFGQLDAGYPAKGALCKVREYEYDEPPNCGNHE